LDDPVDGEQNQRHFSAYYIGYCFLPPYVFCGEREIWLTAPRDLGTIADGHTSTLSSLSGFM